MTERVLGPTGSRRRRRFLLVPLCLVALLGLLVVGGAQAVHDRDFELEGNQAVDGASVPGSFDWTSFFNAAGQESPVLPDASRPGFESSGFAKDFSRTASGGYATFDTSTYATGSKDTLSISPGWQCNRDNNVNDKIDIVNGYAVTYTDPVTDEEFLYFALERFANDGDANVGIWFLQGDVSCVSPGGSVPFTGDHQDGDLLIVSEFSNGGDVSTIQVYEWEGDDNTGGLNLAGVAEGVDCKDSLGGDSVCATVNDATNGVLDPPWDTENKRGGGNNQISEFFEGGLNLTEEGLGGRCFNTFIADTRSSTSATATLFDFALGKLGACAAELTTTPKDGSGNNLAADSDSDNLREIGIGSGSVTVTDSALLNVTGASSFTGTLSFQICGPIANPDPCSSGVSAGSFAVTASGTYLSNAVTLTKVGRYCWRADFTSTTDGVPNASDSRIESAGSTGECFEVLPVQPTLDTQAVASPVTLGSPVQDNATLAGTTRQPGTTGPNATYPSINSPVGPPAGGKITFTLSGPDACNAVPTGTGTNPQDFTPISGDGTYGPVSFTPNATGTYYWKAQYFPAAGDVNNLGTAQHNADCSDGDEDVIVEQFTTSIATRQFVYPQDKAVVSATGGGPLSGTLTFKLYDSLANCNANGDTVGAGGLLYKEGPLTVSGNAPQSKTTNNTTVRIISDATVFWRVTYVSNNAPRQLGSESQCVESTAVDFTGDDGSISIP